MIRLVLMVGGFCIVALASGLQAPRGEAPDAATGRQLYLEACAACHGENGKGTGPVAESLRMKPTDLTRLASKNGGEFPEFRLRRILGGTDEIPGHGSKKMPVWGPAFAQRPGSQRDSAQRVDRLIEYLRSIQQQGMTPAPGK